MDNRSKDFVFIPFCLMAQAFQAQGLVKYEWKGTIKPFLELLIENEIEPGVFQGYTENYIPVRIKSEDKTLIGKIISVTVTDCCDDYCMAE